MEHYVHERLYQPHSWLDSENYSRSMWASGILYMHMLFYQGLILNEELTVKSFYHEILASIDAGNSL